MSRNVLFGGTSYTNSDEPGGTDVYMTNTDGDIIIHTENDLKLEAAQVSINQLSVESLSAGRVNCPEVWSTQSMVIRATNLEFGSNSIVLNGDTTVKKKLFVSGSSGTSGQVLAIKNDLPEWTTLLDATNLSIGKSGGDSNGRIQLEVERGIE
jgi:hypothetical protein